MLSYTKRLAFSPSSVASSAHTLNIAYTQVYNFNPKKKKKMGRRDFEPPQFMYTPSKIEENAPAIGSTWSVLISRRMTRK